MHEAQLQKILNDPRTAVIVEKELPPLPDFYSDWGGESGKAGYKRCQQDMLKAGYKPVIKTKED